MEGWQRTVHLTGDKTKGINFGEATGFISYERCEAFER